MQPSQGVSSSREHAFMPARNPMKIELILEVFFGWCSADTLKNCRLVCKQWRDQSLKAWRSQAMICLDSDRVCDDWDSKSLSVEEYLWCYNHVGNGDRNRDLLLEKDRPVQLRQYPFKNFRIHSNLYPYIKDGTGPILDVTRRVKLENIDRHGGDFKEFLSKFQALQDLEIMNCEFSREETELPLSPNLKRLKILRDCPNTSGLYTGRYLFDVLPSLEVLSLEHRKIEDCMYELRQIMEMVKAARLDRERREDVMPFTLKELEIINFPSSHRSYSWGQVLDSNLLNSIVKCNFPLERFALDLSFAKEIEMKKLVRSIHTLLYSIRESLQYLRLTFVFDIDELIDRVTKDCKGEDMKMALKRTLRPVPRLNIISMDSLKEMKLANGLWGFYLLGHLQLPNLEKLVVEYGKYTGKVTIQQYQVLLLKERVFPKLKTFELLDNHEIPVPEMINAIANMMPNLKRLCVPLDKHTFPIVCKRLKELRTLNILTAECRYAEIDDETLTGVSKWDEEGGHHGRPNITDLASLGDLSISGATLTDHAVIHGFLKLPKLHFLSVSLKKVSHEVMAKLMGHVTGYVQIQEEDRIALVDGEGDDDLFVEECGSPEAAASDEDESGSEPMDSDLD